MELEGTVVWLRSETGREFPAFRYRCRTSGSESGFLALTSTRRNEIVLAEMTGDEWKRYADPDTRAACERRINAELDRSDLKLATVAGLDEFFDIFAGGSCDEIVREEPIADYRQAGGAVTTNFDCA